MRDPTAERGDGRRGHGLYSPCSSSCNLSEFVRVVDCASFFWNLWSFRSCCWCVEESALSQSRNSHSGRMASTCVRQMASLTLKGRVLAAPKPLKVVGLSSPSFTPAVTPSLKQACEPLRSSFQVKTPLTSGRDKFSVIAQAVTTTPETEAEADTTEETTVPETTEDAPAPAQKSKKLTTRVKHIMDILNKEAVEAATANKVIPDIRPGDVIQLRVEVPENKKRVSLLRGIVISRRNAGIQTTFRIRRVIAGVGVEMVFPLYSPNIKEIKVVDKRKVRRAKLFYLRDKIARMSSC